MRNVINQKDKLNHSITYAQALSTSTTSPESIRNITLINANNNCSELLRPLVKESSCLNEKNLCIKQQGKCNTTIRWEIPETTINVKNKLKNKFKDTIQILAIIPTKAMTKITGLATELVNKDDIYL